MQSSNAHTLKQNYQKIMSSKFIKKKIVDLVCYAILICIIFLILYPFFSQIANAFKSKEDLLDQTVIYIPKNPGFAVIKETIKAMNYWDALGNSFLLSLLIATIQTMVSAMIGYGFARYEFPCKKLLFGFVILTIMVPPQIIMNPLYMLFKDFDLMGIIKLFTKQPINMLNSYFSLIVLAITGLGLKNGLYVFLIRQVFRNMPHELDEAAYVDGASEFCVFHKIMLPNAIPVLISCFLISFSWQWMDNYTTPLLLRDVSILPSALNGISNYRSQDLDPIFRMAMLSAGILLVIAPLVILYCFLQKFFVQGIERSGIVG